MVNLEKLVAMAKRNVGKKRSQRQSDIKTVLKAGDFIDLINSEGKIIYLNKKINRWTYFHEAEYKGFKFKASTNLEISNSDEEFYKNPGD